jgi:UPF0716 protein FxsA
MPLLLLLLFIGIPLLEIWVIIQVGSVLGAGWTIVLLVVDSLVGAWLLKVEGRKAWSQFRTALADGRWPGDEVAQGALIIVGGTLLLTPGFVTDVVGFLFLLAPTRRIASRIVRARMRSSATGGAASASGRRAGDRRREQDPRTIGLDVEVVEIEREVLPPSDEDQDPGGSSPR